MQLSTSNPFSDLNVDPIKGTEILSYLGVTPSTLSHPTIFNQVQDILAHLQNVEDYRWFINKAVGAKNVDKLQHVWEYVKLQEERAQLSGDLDKINRNISEATMKEQDGQLDELEKKVVIPDLFNQKRDLTKRVSRIDEELAIYEK